MSCTGPDSLLPLFRWHEHGGGCIIAGFIFPIPRVLRKREAQRPVKAQALLPCGALSWQVLEHLLMRTQDKTQIELHDNISTHGKNWDSVNSVYHLHHMQQHRRGALQ